MLDYIQGLVIIFFEMLCFVLFVDSLYAPVIENKAFLKVLRLVLLETISFVITILCYEYTILRVVLVIIISSYVFKCFNKQSYVKNLAVSTVFIGVIMLVDYIALTIYSSIVPDYENYLEIIQPFVIILSKSILFLVVLLIKRKIDRKNILLLRDSDWIKFLFFPIFTVLITTVIIYNSEIVVKNGLELILWVIACGLVGIDFFVFYFIIDVTNKQSIINEKDLLNVQAQNQLLYYERIKEDIDDQRRLSHEYNNQLECIDTLIHNGNYEELKKYMSEITERVAHDIDYIDSNNAIVNAIVNTKYHEAVEKGITFIFFINDLSCITTSSEDMVVILDNSLNNAIEASAKCKNGIIKLKVAFEENNLIISVKNTYEGIIRKNQDAFITVKDNKKIHGFGIKNIERVVEKNKGIVTTKYDDKEFYISLIIPQ